MITKKVKIMAICCSEKLEPKFNFLIDKLLGEGYSVITDYSLNENEIEMKFSKIVMADEVLFINPNGYIPLDIISEFEFAINNNKKLHFYKQYKEQKSYEFTLINNKIENKIDELWEKAYTNLKISEIEYNKQKERS